MARLSHLQAERDLQKYIIAFLGWAGVAVLALGAAAVVLELQAISGEGDGPGEWVPFRGAMGVVASLISLRLPLLVRRHSTGISRIRGLKGQYLTASVVTAVLPVPGAAFYWWAALPATVVGLVALALVSRIEKIPDEEMTESIDHADPEAWESKGRVLDGRYALLKALGVSFVLTCLLIVALVVYAA